MKYKPGQKVLIVNQRGDSSAYRNYFNTEMCHYSGKIVTLNHESSKGSWRIEEDNRNWSWSEDMFTPALHTPDEAFQLYLKGHITEKGYNDLIRGGSGTS